MSQENKQLEGLAKEYAERDCPIKTEDEYYKDGIDEPYYDYRASRYIMQHGIKRGFKAGFLAASSNENSQAIEILKELCQLKHYKDEVGKDAIYEKRQPELWKKANDFLNSVAASSKGKEEEKYDYNRNYEDVLRLENGIIKFLNWLTDKRPDIAGAGAPISILKSLLNGGDILPSTPQWQLCPKCNGEGSLPIANYEYATGIATFTCDVCNGKKIIKTPESTHQGERRFTLNEVLDIAKDYYAFGVDAAIEIDCGHAPNSPTHTQYFKEKFGINI